MKFVEAKDKYLKLAGRILKSGNPDIRNDPHVRDLLKLVDTLVCELAPKELPKKKEAPVEENKEAKPEPEKKEATKKVKVFGRKPKK